MSHYDKSTNVGYDESDKQLNEELEAMLARTPLHVQRKLQHRIHDALMHRIKEECTRRCIVFLQRLEECSQSRPGYRLGECTPIKDELNQCAHEVNSEETYQKYRMMYLRGELLKFHEDRQMARFENFKSRAPDSISSVKPWQSHKYAHQMQDLGVDPIGNISHDDLKGADGPE